MLCPDYYRYESKLIPVLDPADRLLLTDRCLEHLLCSSFTGIASPATSVVLTGESGLRRGVRIREIGKKGVPLHRFA